MPTPYTPSLFLVCVQNDISPRLGPMPGRLEPRGLAGGGSASAEHSCAGCGPRGRLVSLVRVQTPKAPAC